jgi:flagellar hook-basal body complex protein FliE
MVDGIGSGSGALGREAIRAAIDAQRRAAERIREQVPGAAPAAGAEAPGAGFAQKLADGIQSVNAEIVRAEGLPSDFVGGKVEDFHEVAVQLKQADIGFRFALEIRNKLIDAYREVMRMSV